MADSTENQITSPKNVSDTQIASITTGIRTETVEVPEGYIVVVQKPEEAAQAKIFKKFMRSLRTMISATPYLSSFIFRFTNNTNGADANLEKTIKDFIEKIELPFGLGVLKPVLQSFVIGKLEPVISGRVGLIEYLVQQAPQYDPQMAKSA